MADAFFNKTSKREMSNKGAQETSSEINSVASGSRDDASSIIGGKRRQKYDDGLEEDDYDLIEENLGVKVERRKRFKRLRRICDTESDGEDQHVDEGLAREKIAEELFNDNYDSESHESRSKRSSPKIHNYEDDSESDADDFIVDDNGRPISEKKRRRPMYTDACLQESQDIFGVDFDFDDFDYADEDDYEDESEGDDTNFMSSKKRKSTKKKVSIFDVFEPSELKRRHFTDVDHEIRKVDMPERMQTRQIPVTAGDSQELEDEANWIYRHAFSKATVSEQAWNAERKAPTAVKTIKQALDFIRNQQLEVPFIAFYRKEYIKPDLSIDDLWKIYYHDEIWCLLYERKRKLKMLFEKMRQFQLESLGADPEKPFPDDVRLMLDTDFERLNDIQTVEELKDVHMYFLLNYSHELPKMQSHQKRKLLQERREKEKARKQSATVAATENKTGAENIKPIDCNKETNEVDEQLKQSSDCSPYAVFRKAGICAFVKSFGLTPEEFAENLRENYQRNEIKQETLSPMEMAKKYLSARLLTVDAVLQAAKHVAARQLAQEPLLRKTIREVFFDRARLNIRPTKIGMVQIDENSPVYSMKYVAKKPVDSLFGDQFIKLLMAEEEKLLEIQFLEEFDGNANANGPPGDYVDGAKSLYHLDQFSKHVLEWNALRAECVHMALKKWVIPDLIKELRIKLQEEAQQSILHSCTAKLYKWLKVAPYKPELPPDSSYTDWSTLHGIRTMALAYDSDQSVAAFCAFATVEGDISDYLRLPDILKRKKSHNSEEKTQKLAALRKLTSFIKSKKPHVVVIGAESRDALMIQTEIRDILKELETTEQFPRIEVEIVENELAKVYANSKKGESEFREYPALLKQAVSLARKIQDPLVEYSQLCDADDEILCLRYHPLQDRLPKDLLLEHLSLEFINRTNEVGVDINRMMQNSRTVNLLQYICGLGPRKGQALLKVLKQSNQRLENRTQLVTVCHLGPKIFINCSGFIKIDTSLLGDSTEAYVEVLDGSRVHPETYEWARKMANDAMECEDEETNPAGALDEILESPERLNDLDLDAFALELERRGFGNKNFTLYDIKNELRCLYKDLRTPYAKPSSEELFDMLTKETPETFYVGKSVEAIVIGFAYRRPQGDQLDNANPIKLEEKMRWQCPFCRKDFPQLADVWNHFDDNTCRGQAFGVKLRLDNGLNGFLHVKNLSDKPVRNPEERMRVSQMIYVRIINVDIDRFSFECSSKSTDLNDVNNEWRPRRDAFYDHLSEELDSRKVAEAKEKLMQQRTYTRRIIAHPNFHNKTYADVIALLADADQGEVALRPSSKGSDHLTATWKVADDIYQHIDVREECKENDYSLGRKLWIGTEEFQDLDEIIARHIHPMAMAARELLEYKYYKPNLAAANENERDYMEKLLLREKAKDSKKIHYFFSASKPLPGKFLLSYLPKNKVFHEYVTVIPEGYRLRGKILDSVNTMLCWFKEHWSDASLPPATPSNSSTTPSIMHPPPTPLSVASTAARSTGSRPYSVTDAVYSSTPRSGISVAASSSSFGRGAGARSGGSSEYSVSQPISNTYGFILNNPTSSNIGHYGSSGTRPSSNDSTHSGMPYTPMDDALYMTPFTPHHGLIDAPSPSDQSPSQYRRNGAYGTSSNFVNTSFHGTGRTNAYNTGRHMANQGWANRRNPQRQQYQQSSINMGSMTMDGNRYVSTPMSGYNTPNSSVGSTTGHMNISPICMDRSAADTPLSDEI
ncbi:transcription elongation factor SPT6-like isoform X2 [Drosophila tropicalis]|uniref:transcription elongation factor SPT6-like isoform X2 n=1 Tax=Drosophila tropicalis TaxID=46794 RepID=UPI0035ABD769